MAELRVNDSAILAAVLAEPPRLTPITPFTGERIAGVATVGGEDLTFAYISRGDALFAGGRPNYEGRIDRLEVSRADGSVAYSIENIADVGLADLIGVSTEGGESLDSRIYGGEDTYVADDGDNRIELATVAGIVGTEGITIDGGGGTDTVVLPDPLGAYAVVSGSLTEPGEVVLDGPQGLVTLTGVENVVSATPTASVAVTPGGPLAEADAGTVTFTVGFDAPLAAGQTVALRLSPSYDGAGAPAVDLVAGEGVDSNLAAMRAAIAAAAEAEPNAAYDPETGVLTLNGPVGDFAFDVTVRDDDLAEGAEQLGLAIADAGTGGPVAIDQGEAGVAITDLDAQVRFDISADPTSIAEASGAAASYTLSMTGDQLAGDNTAAVALARSGDAEDGDFIVPPSQALAESVAAETGASLSDGRLSVTSAFDGSLSWTVTPAVDEPVEFGERLTFALSDPTIDHGTAQIDSGSASVVIDEAPAQVPETNLALAVEPARIDEERGETATFNLILDVPGFDEPALRDDNTASVRLSFGGTSEADDFRIPTSARLAEAVSATPGVSREGEVLTFTSAFGGTLSWSLTAADDATNEDRETLTARLSDAEIALGTIDTDPDLATLTVTDSDEPPPPPPPPDNRAPTPQPDRFLADSDGSIFFTRKGLLENDTDPDGDTLKFAGFDASGLAGTLTPGDDGFRYEPGEAFQELAVGESGSDAFTYSVSDGQATGRAQVTITVLGPSGQVPEGDGELDGSSGGAVFDGETAAVTAMPTDAPGAAELPPGHGIATTGTGDPGDGLLT